MTAVQQLTATRTPRGKRPLNRATIVQAALRILDDVGLEGLTTRRLAEELNIKSASLYWHFRHKGELLNEIALAMFREGLRPSGAGKCNGDLSDWLIENARDIRRVALSRRDGAQIISNAWPATSELFWQGSLNAFTRHGLSEDEARLVIPILSSFAIGAAMRQQSALAPSSSLYRLGLGDEGFELGLQMLVGGLRGRTTSRSSVKALGEHV